MQTRWKQWEFYLVHSNNRSLCLKYLEQSRQFEPVSHALFDEIPEAIYEYHKSQPRVQTQCGQNYSRDRLLKTPSSFVQNGKIYWKT